MQAMKLFWAVVAVCASSTFALGETRKPVLIKEYKDWGAYSVAETSGKICYVMTRPKKKSPRKLNHGDVYFFVTSRAKSAPKLEVSFLAGYPFKDNSKVTVTIDKKKFTLMTQGDGAWVEDTANEGSLIAAMKGGRKMTVSAVSRRNNKTRYEMSLSGITAALSTIGSSCN